MNDLIDKSWLLLNSSFLSAIVGALAGTFGSVYIIERIKNRRSILEEIRNTNAAIMIVFGITNLYFGIKNQHVISMYEKYQKSREEVLDKIKSAKGNQNIKEIRFHADLQALEPLPINLDSLEKLIFERISLNGRPLAAFSALFLSMNTLNAMLNKRNSLLNTYRTNPPRNPEESKKLVDSYFGFIDEYGNGDGTFQSLTEGVYRHTDDCIFFSMLLIKDLVARGLELKKSYGRNAPKVNSPKFDSDKTQKLIPKAEEYEDWANAFESNNSQQQSINN